MNSAFVKDILLAYVQIEKPIFQFFTRWLQLLTIAVSKKMILKDGKKSFPHLQKKKIRSNYLINNKRNSFKRVIKASYVCANKQDMEEVDRRLARFKAKFRWVQIGRRNNCRTDSFWKLESLPEWAGRTINCRHK